MKIQIRDRDRRAVIGLVFAIVLYVVLSWIALPAFDQLKTAGDEVTTKEEQLSKYRRALVRKGNYTKLLEQARRNMIDAEARLIRGDNPSLASVEFQTLVEDAAKKSGIGLNQRSVSAAKKKDAFFNEITMALAFDCTPGQLAGFLSELRGSPKLVTVRSAQVAPVQSASEPPKKGEFQKTVRVSLTLAAILAAPPAPAASAPVRKG